MKKQFFKALPLAGAVSFAILSTAASAATVDFGGYVRSGIGASARGGDQAAFQAVGAGSKYRLGNETETYGEITLGSELFNNGEQRFYLDSMMAFEVDQMNDWESTETAFRQFNVVADGVLGFAPEASLWAGKRYYKRQDIHMIDLYYWNVSGPGAGIENVNVGIGDLSFAWVKSSTDVTYWDNADDVGNDDHAKKFSLDQNILDLRLENIETNNNGSLTLGFDYGFGNPSKGIGNGSYDSAGNRLRRSDMEENGYMITAEHTQGDFFGGFNKFVVQYADGSMADHGVGTSGGGLNAAKPYLATDNFIRAMNHGVIGLGDDVEMQHVVGYSRVSYKESGRDNLTWITAGVRPVYFWNDIMSTAVEVGFDHVRNPEEDFSVSNLGKVTIAQQWSAGRGYWARPTIRVFGTYAKWNNESKDRIGGDAFEGKTNGFTFGAQMEAWW